MHQTKNEDVMKRKMNLIILAILMLWIIPSPGDNELSIKAKPPRTRDFC